MKSMIVISTNTIFYLLYFFCISVKWVVFACATKIYILRQRGFRFICSSPFARLHCPSIPKRELKMTENRREVSDTINGVVGAKRGSSKWFLMKGEKFSGSKFRLFDFFFSKLSKSPHFSAAPGPLFPQSFISSLSRKEFRTKLEFFGRVNQKQ